MYLRAALYLFLLLKVGNVHGQIPAFPEAEGFGAKTPGGRGGKIIKVTNLDDDGPGSLRAALEAEIPRIVVFNVGGIINLKEKLIVKHPYITIAGQSAPGEGICIRGEGIRIATHDVVIRYLRIRPGEIDFGPPNDWEHVDAISIGSPRQEVYNIVVDHCSLSWGIDENIDIWYNTHDITIQYCIISEALQYSKHPKGPHSKGLLIGSKATNVSVHHNIFAHNHERNPLINGRSNVDIRNNVIYNPGFAATKIVNWDNHPKSQKVNFVGNYVIPGKSTINNWEIGVFGKNKEGMKIFIENNLGPNITDYQQDNWLLVKDDETQAIASEAIRSLTPFLFPKVTTHTPLEAYNIALSEAGAVLPLRDAVDRKTITDIKNGTGIIINRKIGTLEWPPLASGTPLPDADQDGMPDDWEKEFGLNPHDPNDIHGDRDADGYTNIEEYLNGTSPISSLNNKREAVRTFSQSSSAFELQLFQNFPNPFNSSTNVAFEIPKPADTRLLLVNREGKVLSEILSGFLYDGKYEVTLDAFGLKPGMYFLVLVSNNYPKRIKVIHTGS